MRLANISYNGRRNQLGVRVEAGIVAINPLVERKLLPEECFASSFGDIFTDGGKILNVLRRHFSALLKSNCSAVSEFAAAEEDTVFGPCVESPEKILCVGLNYRGHAKETGAPVPTSPVVFSKFNNALAGHKEPVPMPENYGRVDYEAELAIVMGRYAKNVKKEDALSYVMGYCNANDLSCRELQFKSSQWLLGKTCEKFAPIGPYLVTGDEVPNPDNLTIRLYVNGEMRQNSNTSDMIFSCAELISYISMCLALKPGDIILTGTPQGVILGMPAEKQEWLKKGDQVTVDIENMGTLTNTFC